ncbi:MAG: polysaccharide biosynthesis protein, partial [Bacteroidaceae bacterium]|nr:polysaccharide biosynthesis protein [Bacteroidaceae bacterium]
MDNNQNKRIAKNTIFMYIRMAITMCIGLYTSRAVLQALGVEDFGLYNVIGGIVSMFIILNNAMVNTTSRFITVYLAKDDELQTCRIFNMASWVHIVIAILVVLFAETIGLWYLENKFVVPEGRMFAAHWLYQLSI